MEPREHLVDWLRDAHAMELKAVEILEKQAERMDHFPELRARIEEHLEETRIQADMVADCIERHGGDRSVLKDTAGKFMGNLAALTSAMASDEVVKNAIADYAFEQFEIASYTSLIAAAEAVGDEQTAEICREILEEEEAMAMDVADQLPLITAQFLDRSRAGVRV